MNDDKWADYDFTYGNQRPEEPAEPKVAKIAVTELQRLEITKDEILVIKYDQESTSPEEAQAWYTQFRKYLQKTYDEETASRFIMLPKNWDLQKTKMEIRPKEHPLYEEKQFFED